MSRTLKNPFGLDLRCGPVSQVLSSHEQFDVITLWTVLEHVYHPRELLRDLQKHLVPQGALIVMTPNRHSIPFGLFGVDDIPRHVVLYSRCDLCRLLGFEGFRIVRFVSGDGVLNENRGIATLLWALARGMNPDMIRNLLLNDEARKTVPERICKIDRWLEKRWMGWPGRLQFPSNWIAIGQVNPN